MPFLGGEKELKILDLLLGLAAKDYFGLNSFESLFCESPACLAFPTKVPLSELIEPPPEF
jgi:hypothetical protein